MLQKLSLPTLRYSTTENDGLLFLDGVDSLFQRLEEGGEGAAQEGALLWSLLEEASCTILLTCCDTHRTPSVLQRLQSYPVVFVAIPRMSAVDSLELAKQMKLLEVIGVGENEEPQGAIFPNQMQAANPERFRVSAEDMLLVQNAKVNFAVACSNSTNPSHL